MLIEEKRIEAVKNKSEPKLAQDIHVFIGFANFYCRFIQGFSKTILPLTFILKTKATINVNNKFSKSKSGFLTANAKKAFLKLRQAFTKAPVLQHVDLGQYIWIETNAFEYTIKTVLTQLVLDNSSQWYLVAYFFWKIISAETWYKTHNEGLFAIVELFKSWKQYLKDCNYEVLVLTNHNNFRQFMDTKSLSSCQVRWA